MTGQPVEIVIRLRMELPPGMTLAPVAKPDEPLAYRIPEAARMIGVGQTKVAELVARGEIESFKIDGSRLIRSSDLADYVAKLSGGGSAA